MEIRIEKRKVAGSCNYCDRATIYGRSWVQYPYDEIIEVKGNQTSTRFCKDCFRRLSDFNQYVKQEDAE